MGQLEKGVPSLEERRGKVAKCLEAVNRVTGALAALGRSVRTAEEAAVKADGEEILYLIEIGQDNSCFNTQLGNTFQRLDAVRQSLHAAYGSLMEEE